MARDPTSDRTATTFSGAGKTSLLNAKVIPEIEEDGFVVLPPARVGGELPARIEPDEVENVYVYSVLLALAGEDADSPALLGHTLCSWLEEHLGQRDALVDQPVVLILDQFEEIFTTHLDRLRDIAPFFQQVREALDALPDLGVVLSMREDHVAEIDSYAFIFARRLRARFRMERLGIKGVLDAIRRPALRAGIRYDEGVAERLVDDLRAITVQRAGEGGQETILGPYVEPVQLQVVCNRLWESLPEQEDQAIQWEEIAQYGNVDRALTDFYETASRRVDSETAAYVQDHLAKYRFDVY